MDAVQKILRGKGKSKQIVAFDEENRKATLNADTFRKIIESRPEIENLPTIVITIGGVARSGKSFLLNLLVSYLAHLEKHGNDYRWKQSSSTIKGISWARSGESVTHGIWMFDRPFIVTRYDGSQAAVLLVDSQGTGDNIRSCPGIDTLITYIGLQISSVQVLNVLKYLSSNDLIAMELCTDYADIDDDAPQSMKDTHQEEYLFQSLLFLIRDFTSDDNTLGDDPNLFPELISKGRNSNLSSTIKGIKRAFRNVDSYKMPHPGDKIEKATAGFWKVKDVPANFLQSVSGLAHRLFALKEPKRHSQCWESATVLLDTFEMLKAHMENDDLPPFTNPSDALKAAVMHQAFLKLQHDLGNQIKEVCQSDMLTSYATKEELKQSYENLRNKALENFKVAAKYRKYESTAIARKYLKMSESFFTLMYGQVMERFEYLKMVLELKKKQEEIERQKQNQKGKHKEEVESLKLTIQDYKQRELDSKAQFETGESKRCAEIEGLRKTMAGVHNENKEERRVLQALIDDLRKVSEDEAKAEKAARDKYMNQQAELNAKIDGMVERHSDDVKRLNEEKAQLDKNLKDVETAHENKIKDMKGRKFKKGVARVLLGSAEGAAIGGATFGPIGAGVGAAVGAVANFVVEMI